MRELVHIQGGQCGARRLFPTLARLRPPGG
eukprot:COSAG01_NODE_15478_length_1332_cov_3.896188_1_plen_29_part_10